MRCLAALLVLAAAAVAADTCEAQLKCVSKGSACVGDLVSDTCPLNSTADRCCQWPLMCLNSKCLVSTTGGRCNKDSDCGTSHWGTGVSQCQGGICAELFNAGDECDNATQCYGGMACKDGKCAGISEGQNCTPTTVVRDRASGARIVGYSCAYGHFCNRTSLVCAKALAKGAACGNDTDACEASSVCVRGLCVGRWSLAEGATCDAAQRLGACKAGYYCSNATGTCAKATSLVLQECSDDKDCGSGTTGKCVCSKTSGKNVCEPAGTDSDCSKQIEAAEKCWRNNKCAPVASKTSKTCVQTKCLTSTNKIFACKGECSGLRTTIGCLASSVTDNCPAVPTYAKILIAFGVLIALIAIIAIVYVVVLHVQKKRKQAGGYQAVTAEH